MPFEVDPRHVTLNASGFAWREFMVRLPQSAVANDLSDPTIWRKVQKSPNALRRHDRVYVVAYDESWSAEAIVGEADGSKAVLCKPRLVTFPERFDQLFQTEDFRVAWMGAGYVVERKADGHRLTAPVHSAALAERALREQYPQRV